MSVDLDSVEARLNWPPPSSWAERRSARGGLDASYSPTRATRTGNLVTSMNEQTASSNNEVGGAHNSRDFEFRKCGLHLSLVGLKEVGRGLE